MGDEEFKHRDREVARERRFAGEKREPTTHDLAAQRKAELHAQSLTLHADLRRLIAEAKTSYAKGEDGDVVVKRMLDALDKAVDVIDFQRERIQELRKALSSRTSRRS